jgi:hypothetical protein
MPLLCLPNGKPAMMLRYKFVEMSTVTDDRIEDCVNQWVSQGWAFEGIRFVTNDSSRRPVMAFVSFTRADLTATAELESPIMRSRDPLQALTSATVTSAIGDDESDHQM